MFLNHLRKSQFLKNVAKVAGGAAAGQLILVAASPFITRIFGAEVFGVWGIFNSVALVIVPVASFCYVTAIVLPKDDVDARAIARISVGITAFVSIAVAVFFLLLGETSREWFSGIGESWRLFPLVGLLVFVSSCGEIARQLLIRREKFGSLSIATTGTSAFTAIAQVIGGLLAPVAWVLITANLVAKACDSLAKALLYLRGCNDVSRRPIKRREYVHVIGLYRDFPLFKAPQTLIDALAKSLPTILLGSFFGVASAGFYTLCRTTLLLPNNLIGNAISDVFYPKIASAFNKREKMYAPVLKATLLAAAIGTVPAAVVIAAGPFLFAFVFGAEWDVAGEYARWLSLTTWGMMMNSPAIQAIQILRLQKWHLGFTIFNICFRGGAMILAAYLLSSDVLAVAAYGSASLIATVLLIAYVLFRCKKYDAVLRA